jgi:F0F1-type ATP synthase delta subunit
MESNLEQLVKEEQTMQTLVGQNTTKLAEISEVFQKVCSNTQPQSQLSLRNMFLQLVAVAKRLSP